MGNEYNKEETLFFFLQVFNFSPNRPSIGTNWHLFPFVDYFFFCAAAPVSFPNVFLYANNDFFTRNEISYCAKRRQFIQTVFINLPPRPQNLGLGVLAKGERTLGSLFFVCSKKVHSWFNWLDWGWGAVYRAILLLLQLQVSLLLQWFIPSFTIRKSTSAALKKKKSIVQYWRIEQDKKNPQQTKAEGYPIRWLRPEGVQLFYRMPFIILRQIHRTCLKT